MAAYNDRVPDDEGLSVRLVCPWPPSLSGMTLLAAAVFAACVFWTYVQEALTSRRRRLPLPPLADGTPLVGDTFKFLQQGPYCGAEHHNKHGSMYRAYMLGQQVVHVGDADAIKQLLASEHKLVEADWPWVVQKLMGPKTIALITHQRHLEVRKMLLPAFAPKTMLQYIPRITEIAEEFCKSWAASEQLKGEQAMKAYTGKIVTEMILGFDKSFATPELLARQDALFETLHQGLFALPINLPGTDFNKAIKAREAIAAMYRENICRLAEGMDRPEEGRVLTSMEMVVKAAKQSGDSYYDMQFLEDTCFHLVFAGHDTSASALTMLLSYLKQEPQVLHKLRQEQKQVIAKHGREVTADYLADMAYADMTCRETLRLAIVIPQLPRRAQTDLEVGGYTIPKGMKIALQLWKVLQEDPRWLAADGEFAPTRFNPDRWLDADKTSGFYAFSGGARHCPGQTFAIQEMKIMIAVLARDYDWTLDLQEPMRKFPFPGPTRGMPMTLYQLSSTHS